MAEKGLITKSTLQGFADEIRKLTKTTTTGTPAEMLTLLQTFKSDYVCYGSVTLTEAAKTINFGVSLPEFPQYALFIVKYRSDTGSLNIVETAYIIKASNFTVNRTKVTSGSTVYDDMTIDFINGTATVGRNFSNVRHDWFYAGWN